MAYRDFKYLTRRTASDKILRYKASNIAKKLNENVSSGTTSSGSGIKELAEELNKPIIRKFKSQSILIFYR